MFFFGWLCGQNRSRIILGVKQIPVKILLDSSNVVNNKKKLIKDIANLEDALKPSIRIEPPKRIIKRSQDSPWFFSLIGETKKLDL